MVDELRVLRLLRSISDDLAVLRAEASADPGRRADPLWLRGVKYTFVTAIEAAVDVAQHVCAVQGWGPPRDNGDAIHGTVEVKLSRSKQLQHILQVSSRADGEFLPYGA